MIIQSSNKPIILDFSEDIEGITIRATLWDEKNVLLKQWTNNEMEIDETIAILPLSQEETGKWEGAHAKLEVKWLDRDGITEFAETEILLIDNKNDTTPMGVAEND